MGPPEPRWRRKRAPARLGRPQLPFRLRRRTAGARGLGSRRAPLLVFAQMRNIRGFCHLYDGQVRAPARSPAVRVLVAYGGVVRCRRRSRRGRRQR